jgi:hypothetical protein
MEKKVRTVTILKETRKVPEHVDAERKKYIQIRRTLREALKDQSKTIPELAVATQLLLPDVTYYLMSMLKFGEVDVDGIDDMDEYYFYKLKK